jgi:hypothetical protein
MFLIQIVCHKSIINKGEAVLMFLLVENPTVERVNSNMYSVFSSVLYVFFNEQMHSTRPLLNKI